MTPGGILDWSIVAGMALVLLSLLFGFARLARGPSFSDRVVALDMMNVSMVAFCALVAMWTQTPAFLDVGIVLALIGFLATVALARFAERGLHRKQDLPNQADKLIDPLATEPGETKQKDLS